MRQLVWLAEKARYNTSQTAGKVGRKGQVQYKSDNIWHSTLGREQSEQVRVFSYVTSSIKCIHALLPVRAQTTREGDSYPRNPSDFTPPEK